MGNQNQSKERPKEPEEERKDSNPIYDELKIYGILISVCTLVLAILANFTDCRIRLLDYFIKGSLSIIIILGSSRIIIKIRELVKQFDQTQRKPISKKLLCIAIPSTISLIILGALSFFPFLFGIQNYIDGEKHKHQTALNTFCYSEATDTPTPTSTNTITPTPTLTLTPTPTPTPTPTITPSPTLGLESACIPEIWGVFPLDYAEANTEPNDDGCLKFSDTMYISAIFDGFRIDRDNSSPSIIKGLIRKVDFTRRVNIQFTIVIYEFDIPDEVDKGYIYFGLIDPDDYYIYEDMFRIQKNGISLPHFYKDTFTAEINNITDGSELFINLTIDRDGTLNYYYQYNGSTSEPVTLHYSDKNDHFFIGYKLPKNSSLQVEFQDFQFNEY